MANLMNAEGQTLFNLCKCIEIVMLAFQCIVLCRLFRFLHIDMFHLEPSIKTIVLYCIVHCYVHACILSPIYHIIPIYMYYNV